MGTSTLLAEHEPPNSAAPISLVKNGFTASSVRNREVGLGMERQRPFRKAETCAVNQTRTPRRRL